MYTLSFPQDNLIEVLFQEEKKLENPIKPLS